MSLMKRYAEDVETLTLRAAYAAWEPTSTLRMKALTEVFGDCRTAANIYANPAMVARLFVKAVTKAFMHERTVTTYREAG
jgi:hypothetical protein